MYDGGSRGDADIPEGEPFSAPLRASACADCHVVGPSTFKTFEQEVTEGAEEPGSIPLFSLFPPV